MRKTDIKTASQIVGKHLRIQICSLFIHQLEPRLQVYLHRYFLVAAFEAGSLHGSQNPYGDRQRSRPNIVGTPGSVVELIARYRTITIGICRMQPTSRSLIRAEIDGSTIDSRVAIGVNTVVTGNIRIVTRVDAGRICRKMTITDQESRTSGQCFDCLPH